MNKAVFLDRDGTINTDKGYLYKIEEFEYREGAVEGLRILQKAGYLLIVITNQSGIARGLYSESDYLKISRWMEADLKKRGVHLTASYYCPHLPDAPLPGYRVVCDCRKPLAGMFMRASGDYDVDLNKSYAIGDRLRDCQQICCLTECHGFLLEDTEEGEIIKQVKAGKYRNIAYAKNLLCCAQTISHRKVRF